MKRLLNKWHLLMVIVLVMALITSGLTGCIKTTVTVSPAATTTTTAGPLTVVNGTQTKTLTMSDIKGLPAISGSTGLISSSGSIDGPYLYQGVALTDIIQTVGGITAANAIRITAKDGYSMTFSYNQVVKGTEFPTYDSTTGKEVTPAGAITLFIAYQKDGNVIDDTVGPLRVAIMAPGQVTDGHWWIKWAQKIEVISVQQPWTLSLQGAIDQTVDQATFEAGAAPGCHGKTWTDANGHVWTGIPLWYLIGNVDDANGNMSYNDTLADSGYEVHVANSDGNIVMFTAQQVKRNDNIILAYQEDGQPLSSAQWPLALVGSGVDSQHQISKIIKVRLILPSTTTTTTP
jgi:hypothetical protein